MLTYAQQSDFENAQLALLLSPLIKILTGEIPYFSESNSRAEDGRLPEIKMRTWTLDADSAALRIIAPFWGGQVIGLRMVLTVIISPLFSLFPASFRVAVFQRVKLKVITHRQSRRLVQPCRSDIGISSAESPLKLSALANLQHNRKCGGNRVSLKRIKKFLVAFGAGSFCAREQHCDGMV